ncbi:MAG: 2-hydroxyhepta-2,4-diene-1,7-dioate isomerase [Chloroflexi bacterium]|nr:2-hydroxyhepta-2,4-diene-1,7-dioate isomerase [Chloroflexota bacterium]
MYLCRFQTSEQGVRLGLMRNGTVYDLSAIGQPCFATLAGLVRESATTPLATLLSHAPLSDLPAIPLTTMGCPARPQGTNLLPPVDHQEVWAAGVTYAWSREARVREAAAKEIYVKVYEAPRPELFFKSTPDKVVGHQDWVGIRGDSRWNVPEPELALLLNPRMEIIGYTIGNDMSSRDIEGENPLYLPQAKVFRHGCALGPAILIAREGVDPGNLAVKLHITRSGQTAFQGETHTSKIHRKLEELARYLGAYNDFPNGAFLLTGTGVVPPDDFTLQDGDVVSITIDGIGTLTNTVRQM